jgi:hypothetical protein
MTPNQAKDHPSIRGDNPRQHKVKPDSLRVSYFYKAMEFKNDRAGFRRTLGTLFIPAWTQLTAPLGLTAYIPSVPPQTDASPQIPDEIAIVFFESKAVYSAIKDSTAGRLCGKTLHGSVFAWQEDPSPLRKSSSGFPSRMPDLDQGRLAFQPQRDQSARARREAGSTGYYLFDNEADWYHGATRVYVGARPKTLGSDDYRQTVHQAFSDLRRNRPAGLEGLLFVLLEDCLIYWAHWDSPGTYHQDLLADLKRKLSLVMDRFAEAKAVPPSISQGFEGFPDLRDGDSYAIQFHRRQTQKYP